MRMTLWQKIGLFAAGLVPALWLLAGLVLWLGVIDNMDNTKKPVNAGFSAVTLKENQTSVPDQHRYIRTDDPL